jgi:hypothetical protein
MQSSRDQLLAAIERHRRLKLAVGQLRQVLPRALDAGVALDVVVPGGDVGIADRPVDGDTFLRVCLEVEIAPAVTLPPPHQRAATDLIAAIPVEAFDLGVRIVLVGRPEGEVLLVERVVPLQHRIRLLH